MKKEYLKYGLLFVMVVSVFGLLVSCGSSGSSGGSGETTSATTTSPPSAAATTSATTTIGTTTTTTTTEPPPNTPTYLSLGATKLDVLSNNTDSATIIATVQDENYGVMEGVWVSWSATGGWMGTTEGQTDENGETSTTFKSGTIDPTNRVVWVTATVVGVAPVSIPMQIVGSYVTLSTVEPPVINEGNSETLTVTAYNAAGIAVAGTPITFSVDAPGVASVTPSSGNTDFSGQVQVNVNGLSAGDVTVTADGLGDDETQDYTVVGIADTFFHISMPTEDPAGYSIGQVNPLGVEVTTPPSASLPAYTTYDVVFATTIGTLTGTAGYPGGGDPIPVGKVIRQRVFPPVVPGDGFAAVEYTSTEAGTATIQATELFDAGLATESYADSDSLAVNVAAAPEDAARITLQPAVSSVGLLGTEIDSAELIATVTTADGAVVGGAIVEFSYENSTGGGESVAPVLDFTDTNGQAVTTFTAGNLSSPTEGVTVVATVFGEGESFAGDSDTISFSGDTLVVNELAFVTFVDTDANAATFVAFTGDPCPVVVGPPYMIVRTSGSFETDGFEVGARIQITDSFDNNGTYTITNVSGAVITVAEPLCDSGGFDEWVNITTLGPDFIRRSDPSGDWTTNLAPGDVIKVTGSVLNDGTYTLDAVTATQLTLVLGDQLLDESAGANVTVVKPTPTPHTIDRTSGDWAAEGFEPGEQIRVSGSQYNDGIYIVDSVTPGALTLDPSEFLIGEPAVGGVTDVTVTAVSTTAQVVIGGTAGSVSVGRGTLIEELDPATYKLPMSVVVADSAGKAVPNAVVSLGVWPLRYSTGIWVLDPFSACFVPVITGTYNNEDVNENLVLDPGEDVGSDPGHGDGELTPHNSAGGALPPEPLLTDEFGVATFFLVYNKMQSVWIMSRVTATTYVLGTETNSSTTFRLPYDLTEGCAGLLSASPYNLE